VRATLAAMSLAGAAWLLIGAGSHASRRLRPSATRDRRRTIIGTAPAGLGRRRLQQHRDAEAVTFCGAFAAELRAGLPPAAALSSAAAELALLGPRLLQAAHAVGRGAFLGEELAQAAADSSCARLAAAAAVCAAGEATGSGIADVLDRVGRGMASDDEAAAELAALAAGPRATAVVLAALPLMAVALATALGLAPLRILFHTALGVALWTSAGALEVLGVCWVRRITAGALSG
jgi:tight adherence protein B